MEVGKGRRFRIQTRTADRNTLVGVMLFGSKKIPEIARGLGKGMRELKDASNDIKREIRSSANSVKEEVQKVEKDLEK